MQADALLLSAVNTRACSGTCHWQQQTASASCNSSFLRTSMNINSMAAMADSINVLAAADGCCCEAPSVITGSLPQSLIIMLLRLYTSQACQQGATHMRCFIACLLAERTLLLWAGTRMYAAGLCAESSTQPASSISIALLMSWQSPPTPWHGAQMQMLCSMHAQGLC